MLEDTRIPNLETWLSVMLNKKVKLAENDHGAYSTEFNVWKPHMSCRVLDADLYNRLAVAAGVKPEQWIRLNDKDFSNRDGTPYWRQIIVADGHIDQWTIQPDHLLRDYFLEKYGVQHGLVVVPPTLKERTACTLGRFVAYFKGNK